MQYKNILHGRRKTINNRAERLFPQIVRTCEEPCAKSTGRQKSKQTYSVILRLDPRIKCGAGSQSRIGSGFPASSMPSDLIRGSWNDGGGSWNDGGGRAMTQIRKQFIKRG